MRTVKFTTLITRSFERTEEVLFRPFMFKKWLRWALIMALSGSLAGAFNFFNYSAPQNNPSSSTKVTEQSSVRKAPSLTKASMQSSVHKAFSSKRFAALDNWAWGAVALIVVLTVLFFVCLSVFFTWLQSRFKFVWFHVLTSGDTPITQAFGQYRIEGKSLFKFYLLNMFMVMAVVSTLVCAGIVLEIFSKFDLHDIGIWWVFIILAVFSVAFLIYWSIVIVALYVGNFVVLIMAMDRCAFKEAWQKFWKIYWANRKDFAGYLLSLILMSLVLGIAMGIIIVLLMVGVLLAGLLIFGGLYLILAFFLKLKLVFMALAVILGIPFVLGMFVLIYLAYLPSSVFTSYFSYYFFSSLNAGYQPVSLEKPPTT